MHSPSLFIPLLSALLVLGFLVHGFLTSERSLVKALRADDDYPNGSQDRRGLQRALREVWARGQGCPRVAVFPDTTPRAYAIRAWGGAGRVLISKGLLSTAKDEEIEEIFRRAQRRFSKRGIYFKSAGTGWLARLGRAQASHMTPFRALTSWMLFPLRSKLERQERALDLLDRSDRSMR